MSTSFYFIDEINSINFAEKINVCRYIMEIMEIKYNTDKLKVYTNEQLNLFLCKAITSLIELIDEDDN